MKEQDAARKEPNNFCVTKPSTCTMNYCDENGCQDRKRNLVDVGDYVTGSKEQDAAHSFTEPPKWYTKDQMYHWLIRENYSEQIAKELSGKWSEDLQGAFNKGYEKSVNELTSLRDELIEELKKEKNDLIHLYRMMTNPL